MDICMGMYHEDTARAFDKRLCTFCSRFVSDHSPNPVNINNID